MTTNAGASEQARPPMGFNRERREGEDTEAVNRLFTPEFRNRLDAVIPFSGLPPEVISKVVEKFIFQLEAQLADRGVVIEFSEGAQKWIGEKGYDEKFGARPLARIIQEHVKKPLADELLFGKLENGGTVKVLVQGKGEDSKLIFDLVSADPTKKPKTKEEEEEDEEEKKPPSSRQRRPGRRCRDRKEKKEKPGRSSGAVPNVPRKKDD